MCGYGDSCRLELSIGYFGTSRIGTEPYANTLPDTTWNLTIASRRCCLWEEVDRVIQL